MSPRTNPVYTAQVPHYLAQHEAFAAARSGDPDWLVALRADAIARFAELGFPSTRLEEWKYTNVAEIAKLALECEAGPTSPELPAKLGSVLEAKDRAFALLNTAFVSDVSLVEIPSREIREEPVRIEVGSGAGVQHPRVFIEAGAGSQATVVLDHTSDGTAVGLTNVVVEAEVAANAALDLVIVQREHAGRFRSHVLTLGGALVRNDLDVVLADEGAECDLRGLFIGQGDGVIDNHTSVDHAMPHGTSRELYKGILGDSSRGVFRGRVIVRPDAQKTDATQSNPNLLLGARAEIDTKPQLEIYADDVKCAHGATVGQLDPDALFYLRSRAIGEGDARQMLVHAFANEIVDGLPKGVAEPLVEAIDTAVEQAR